MAKIYISEYVALAHDIKGMELQAVAEPSVAEQMISIGAGSIQSAPFNAQTTIIRVHSDAVCSIAIGPNPTAVATQKRVAANAVEYFGVISGHILAVIANT